MTDYTELVKQLRDMSIPCDGWKDLYAQAADAIEKLEAYCDLYKECGEKLMEAMRRIKEGST